MSIIDDPLHRKKRAYQGLFGDGSHGEARTVLADLRRFARLPNPPVVHDPTGRADPMETGRMIGRQEVVNRILAFVHIDERTLFNLKEETASDE